MIVHFILPGETLESISEDIKLENPEYLKEYHNKYCSRLDYIENDLVPGKKLLIPDVTKVVEFNAKNDALFKSSVQNPKIEFNPENLHKRYSFEILETKEYEKSITGNILSFEIDVKWMGKENENHIFHLFKNKISSNNDSKMTDLAIECIQSLGEIIIKTNLKGELKSISLSKEITDDFSAIKERLKDLFPGQYAAIYLDEFEYVVLNEELFSKRMKEDTFIKTYFAAIRNDFKDGKSHFKQLISDDIFLDIEQKVKNDDSQELVLSQNGYSEENKTDYKGKYILEQEKGIIKRAEIYYSTHHVGEKNFTRLIID
ncbi:hypothetical protein [Chryseobacterium oryctis]|uniref:LysM domain-containing protein n=1 Tax=Chryseobacterium oryctis TaxID=2952618 RepID=A0ABT3HNQ1_9FLAO|nr:hypothetical protein [Chryseobacterium oryctis]MCW3161426.1 hypothetical protein [Chryseobacterium oryctis]